MKPLEKLARDICWAEFVRPTKASIGHTRASYWAGLPEETKTNYKDEAVRLAFMVRKLKLSAIRLGSDSGPLEYTSLLRG